MKTQSVRKTETRLGLQEPKTGGVVEWMNWPFSLADCRERVESSFPTLPSLRPQANRSNSVERANHHADGLERVEASSVFSPEDPILELAAVHTSGVPHPVQISLPTRVVPPAAFVEVSTVASWGEEQ